MLNLRLSDLHRMTGRIRNKMDDPNNYTTDPVTNKRIYKAKFRRTKEYIASQQEWYKYYERELGDITKLSSLVIQSS